MKYLIRELLRKFLLRKLENESEHRRRLGHVERHPVVHDLLACLMGF